MTYLGTLCLVLLTTAFAGSISRKIGMPAVIGQLLVGIILGPAMLGWVTNNNFVHIFSEIGVVILMFMAGLESDLDLFKKYITNFSYEVLPYCEENLNYMGAFEKLVQRSDGEYIAFCDQDDIWMDDKVEKCVAYMNEKNIDLVVTDKQIIDENDNVTCSSVRKHSNKNYDNWNTYDDITKYNIFVTYAVGMSIIMKASFAKKSLPFSKYTGHDKWVLACTSTEGKVGYLNLPLVQYRRHGKNVSGVLIGIETKEDYINQRIMPDLKMIEDFKQKYPNHKDLNEIEKFANARRTGNIKTLFKLRYLAPDIAKFDIVTALLPKKLFSFMVKIAQKIS